MSALAGVLVGAMVGAGAQPRGLLRALGHPHVIELLVQLAKHPPPVVQVNGDGDVARGTGTDA